MLFIKACRHYGLMKDKKDGKDEKGGGMNNNAVFIGKNLNIDLL